MTLLHTAVLTTGTHYTWPSAKAYLLLVISVHQSGRWQTRCKPHLRLWRSVLWVLLMSEKFLSSPELLLLLTQFPHNHTVLGLASWLAQDCREMGRTRFICGNDASGTWNVIGGHKTLDRVSLGQEHTAHVTTGQCSLVPLPWKMIP